MAAQLGDYTMCENFAKGIDPHTATARLMLGLDDTVELTDAQRQVGKTGNFSIMYAGGVPTIMRQLKCDKEEAKRLLARLRATMPGIKELNDELIHTFRTRGYVRSIAGRHLSVDPAIVAKSGMDRAESALLNYIIQGSAAELMRHGLIKMHYWLRDRGFQSHIVNVVHDEAQLDVVIPELEALCANLPRLMGNAEVEEYVAIAVDIEVSETSWADKHPIKVG